jgi:hypothetical protein
MLLVILLKNDNGALPLLVTSMVFTRKTLPSILFILTIDPLRAVPCKTSLNALGLVYVFFSHFYRFPQVLHVSHANPSNPMFKLDLS